MARNRQIKSDFFDDEKIGELSFMARLLFQGTWIYADDRGICRANPIFLKSQVFKYDDVKISQVEKALSELIEKELVLLGEHKGQKYLLVNGWNYHQKIDRPSKKETIAGTLDNEGKINQIFRQDSTNTRRVIDEHSMMNENENENVNVNGNENDAHFDFERLYKKYPRKQGKKKGIARCKSNIRSQEKYALLDKAIDNYRSQVVVENVEKKFIKHFSTFMSCWEDYIPPDKTEDNPDFQEWAERKKAEAEFEKSLGEDGSWAS